MLSAAGKPVIFVGNPAATDAMASVLILVFAGVVWLAKRPKGPLKQVRH
jgi:hypothetical protein